MDMNHGPGSSYMLAANEKINQLKQQGQSPDQVHATMLDAVKNGLLPFTVAVQALKQYSDPMQAPPQFPKPGSVVGDLLAANQQRQAGIAGVPNPVMANSQFAGGVTGEPAAPVQGMAKGGIIAFDHGGNTPDDPYGVYADSPVFKYFKPTIDAAQADLKAQGDPTTYRQTAENETEAQFNKYGIGNFNEREARIAEREARLAKQEKNAGLDAFIKGAFGMAAAGARPGATFLGAAAEGANQGFEAYGAGKDKIELAKQAVSDARDRLLDAQQAVKLGKMSASSKAYETLVAKYDAARSNLRNAQALAGTQAADYAGKKLSADSQIASARLYANNKNKNENAYEPQIQLANKTLIEMRQLYPADSPQVIKAEESLRYWYGLRATALSSSNATAFGAVQRSDTALTVAEAGDKNIMRAYAVAEAAGNRKLTDKSQAAQAAYDKAMQELRRARAIYHQNNSGINSPPPVDQVSPPNTNPYGSAPRDPSVDAG